MAKAAVKAAVVAEAVDARATIGAVGQPPNRKAAAEGANREPTAIGAGAATPPEQQADDRRRGVAGRHQQDGRVAGVAAQVNARPVRVAGRPVTGQGAVAAAVAAAQVARQTDGGPAVRAEQPAPVGVGSEADLTVDVQGRAAAATAVVGVLVASLRACARILHSLFNVFAVPLRAPQKE